ncbi:MAG: hypothetical protein JJ911_08820 [Rhizobiaceae bacterium]|nr:hypothetical protein [Rhizobiaceae bacterium]
MNVTMTLTMEGMLRALKGRAHSLADEIESAAKAKRGIDDETEATEPNRLKARRDDRASR